MRISAVYSIMEDVQLEEMAMEAYKPVFAKYRHLWDASAKRIDQSDLALESTIFSLDDVSDVIAMERVLDYPNKTLTFLKEFIPQIGKAIATVIRNVLKFFDDNIKGLKMIYQSTLGKIPESIAKNVRIGKNVKEKEKLWDSADEKAKAYAQNISGSVKDRFAKAQALLKENSNLYKVIMEMNDRKMTDEDFEDMSKYDSDMNDLGEAMQYYDAIDAEIAKLGFDHVVITNPSNPREASHINVPYNQTLMSELFVTLSNMVDYFKSTARQTSAEYNNYRRVVEARSADPKLAHVITIIAKPFAILLKMIKVIGEYCCNIIKKIKREVIPSEYEIAQAIKATKAARDAYEKKKQKDKGNSDTTEDKDHSHN